MNTSIRKIITLSLFALSALSHASDELKLNAGLPMMVDSKTQLNEILLKDMTVIYTYQLKDIEVDEAVMLKEKNKEFIQQNACKDKQIQCLFQKDLDVKFVYKIQNEQILEVNVNKDFCSQINDSTHCTV